MKSRLALLRSDDRLQFRRQRGRERGQALRRQFACRRSRRARFHGRRRNHVLKSCLDDAERARSYRHHWATSDRRQRDRDAEQSGLLGIHEPGAVHNRRPRSLDLGDDGACLRWFGLSGLARTAHRTSSQKGWPERPPSQTFPIAAKEASRLRGAFRLIFEFRKLRVARIKPRPCPRRLSVLLSPSSSQPLSRPSSVSGFARISGIGSIMRARWSAA
jgi:hypothetical protein